MRGLVAASCAAMALGCVLQPDARAAEAGPPAASEPVVKNGLSISVRPIQLVYAQGEPLGLTVTLRNASKTPLLLAGTVFRDWRPSPGLAFLVKDSKTGKLRTLREGVNPMIQAPVKLENRTLPPGSSVVVEATLDQWAWEAVSDQGQRPRSGRDARQWLGPGLLPSGEYEVTARCTLDAGLGQDGAFWTGEVESRAVSVRIGRAAAPDGGAPEPGKQAQDGGWLELFAQAQWYKNQEGAEQQFTGILEAVPGAGGPSTLMRDAYYRLGQWRVYTGGRKHPALDRLVGRPVQLRGKAVELDLEGQHLREIWPGRVRPVLAQSAEPGTPAQ